MKKIRLISHWFVNKLHPTPLKLQKLLYFSQGTNFCMHDEELFSENFEGWVHGPVIREIYNEFKKYGKDTIQIIFEDPTPQLDEKTIETLEEVKNTYGKYDGDFLEKLTHNQDPWIYSRRGLDPDERNDKTIPKNMIFDYFLQEMHLQNL